MSRVLQRNASRNIFQRLGKITANSCIKSRRFTCLLLAFTTLSLLTLNWQIELTSRTGSFLTSQAYYRAEINELRRQRIQLSRLLNELKQSHGQQNCQLRELQYDLGKIPESYTTESGGWCRGTGDPTSIHHRWDGRLSRQISHFLKGKTVGSFGEGPGFYKKHCDCLNEILNYTAYDGAPFSENVTDGLVKFVDMTVPQFGLPIFDWVISLEVAEHIPPQKEGVYLNNLVRHAREGIILSWAMPGQDGMTHLNNKNLDHVMDRMKAKGFMIDMQKGKALRTAAKFWWLKNNIHIYYRESPDSLVIEDA